jgi:SAM-dependent methyltransferase
MMNGGSMASSDDDPLGAIVESFLDRFRRGERAGFHVLGIDLSPALTALARRRVRGGSFRVESLLSAELPPCVAIAAIGDCFTYLFDDQHSEEAVRGVFRRAYDSLQPGGVLMTDVAAPGRLPGPGV